MDTSPQRLRELVRYVREDLDTEVKGWLDLTGNLGKADLAQALLALANHGGGYVVIGFDEAAGTYVPAPGRRPLVEYTQDVVNNIVERFASPRFHCDVHLVADDQGDEYPVVVVHGGHTVPVRAARGGPDNQHVRQNVYYIRRHGPRSEAPQTPEEWDALMRRCVRNARVEMLDSVRAILAGAPLPAAGEMPGSRLDLWIEQASESWVDVLDRNAFPEDSIARLPLGAWSIAYELVGDVKQVSLPEFRQIMVAAEGNETGWPAWMMQSFGVLQPSPVGPDTIACSLAQLDSREPSDCDYWQARRDGLAFLLRGYQEDGQRDRVEAGTTLDIMIPIWRIAEALLHSERVAAQLVDGPARARVRVKWAGLQNRRLVSIGRPLMYTPIGVSQVDEVTSEVEYPMEAVQDTLPELTGRVLEPLYAAFNFYQIPPQVLQREIDSMRR